MAFLISAQDDYQLAILLSVQTYTFEYSCSARARFLIKLAPLFKTPPSKGQN